MNYMEDENFKNIVYFIKEQKVQVILIAMFLIWSLLNYSFVVSTATVAFFTYKFWNKMMEKLNEKIDYFNMYTK